MEMFSGMLKAMFDSVTLEISGNQLTVRMADMGESVGSTCTVKGTDGANIVADCVTDNETDELLFKTVDSQHIRITNVGEEDCEICVWKRVSQ